ncbi:MAG: hypothetical protein ACRDA5_03150, partial [Clostridium sp.]
MKEYKQITRGKLFISMLLNPLLIFIYCISMYELYTLCKFGTMKNNIIFLALCVIFDFTWLIIFIGRARKIKANQSQDYEYENHQCIDEYTGDKLVYKTIWKYMAILILIVTTLFYGYKIYNTSIKYNGKLAWILEDFNNKRTVKLEHNNIFNDGVEGILTDINNKIKMPQELYISDSFELNFTKSGTITSFDTFVYGKDNKGKDKSFLISYDINKSNKIEIRQNGYVNANYNKDKLLTPLINTIKVIPFNDTINKWDEDEYSIVYYGKRSFGYNTDGIVYIDLDSKIKIPTDTTSEIIGYTVSLFVPEKESKYTPIRYNLVEDLENIFKENSLDKNDVENNKEQSSEDINKTSGNKDDEFYLSNKIGYKLEINGAAAGSRFYSLYGTSDGGSTWDIVNGDPFSGSGGGASGITFINEKLGFLALSHSGGSYSDLYRTEDGG